MLRPALACAALLWLTACASITAQGLVTAARLSPLTLDPVILRAAVILPATIELRDGDVTLTLSYRLAGERQPRVHLKAPLEFVDTFNRQTAPAPGDGERVFVARLRPDDAAAFQTAQNEITKLKQQGSQGKGSLGITIDGGCTRSRTPISSLPSSTYLQSDPQTGFVQMTRRTDLLASLEEPQRAALISKIKRCSA